MKPAIPRRRWLATLAAWAGTRATPFSAALAALAAARPGLAADAALTGEGLDRALAALSQKSSARWLQLGERYVASINRYHAAMYAWEAAIESGKKVAEPAAPHQDPRRAMAAEVLKLARRALPNASAAQLAQWRAAFPFGYDALIGHYAEDSCSVQQCFALDGDDCAVIVEDFLGAPSTLGVKRGRQWKFDQKVSCIGRSGNRKVWAFATARGIETRSGFDGPVLARFSYPKGNEGLPRWLKLAPSESAHAADVLHPFNDGLRLVLANATGVYLLTATGHAATADAGVVRLHPQSFEEDGPYTWPKNRSEGERSLSLDMLHVALSPDEKYIALGEQDSQHLLLSATGKVLATAEPGNYPHYALFDRASEQVLFNECHLYSGSSGVLRLAEVAPAAQGEAKAHELRTVDPYLRVYSGAAGPTAANAFYLGGSGYLNCVALSGVRQWAHHVGGSVTGLDFTADDKYLWTASYSGLLARLETRGGAGDPMRIGTSPLWDVERWLFLKDASAPIPW